MVNKKLTKKSEKWKPKRKWIESMTIDLETSKTKYKYFTPKTPEEEKQLESDWDAKMDRIFDILFNEANKNFGTKS